jgi:hypothetical protein
VILQIKQSVAFVVLRPEPDDDLSVTILACRVMILACRTKLIHFKNLITHFLSIQFGRYGVRRLVGQQQRYQILKQARHFAIFRFRVLELHINAMRLVVLLMNE